MSRPYPPGHVHGNTGAANGNWAGGTTTTNKGYRKVMIKGHERADRDGYVLEHVIVAEKSIGRKLTANEVVHHLDGNKLNNDPLNLMVFRNHADHLKYGHHRKGITT